MTTYYNLNKDKILNYKKEFYKIHHQYQHALKNIKLHGFSKRQSMNIIKTALASNCLVIVLNEITHLTIQEFVQKYKFKDYSVLELDGFDTKLSSGGSCEHMEYDDLMVTYNDEKNHIFELMVWDNMILKIN